jgi:hypothetical protein
MANKYKVGDKVFLKSLDALKKLARNSGNYLYYKDSPVVFVISTMAELCEKAYVIKEAFQHAGVDTYKLEGGNQFSFINDWLEPVKVVKTAPLRTDIRKGDLVTIKSLAYLQGMSAGEDVSGLFFNDTDVHFCPDMYRYCGKTLEVEHVGRWGFTLKGNDFNWSKKFFAEHEVAADSDGDIIKLKSLPQSLDEMKVKMVCVKPRGVAYSFGLPVGGPEPEYKLHDLGERIPKFKHVDAPKFGSPEWKDLLRSIPSGEHSANGQTKEREKTTMANVSVLVQLADTKQAEEAQKYGAQVPGDIRAAIQRKQAKQAEENAEAAADEIMGLFKQSDQLIANNVAELQRIRSAEKGLLAKMKEIERAKKYGSATNNWLPLYINIYGMSTRLFGTDKALLEVPKDWAELTTTV